jgi:hypothetical protein
MSKRTYRRFHAARERQDDGKMAGQGGKKGLDVRLEKGMYILAGDMNEFADFSQLLDADPPLRLNLRGVRRFNSVGIRNFLFFLGKWGDKDIEYHECPSGFIDQVNFIPEIVGSQGPAAIKSLFVPYACDVCSHEEEILGRIADFGEVAQGKDPPTRVCPKCKGTMQITTLAYFAFLES